MQSNSRLSRRRMIGTTVLTCVTLLAGCSGGGSGAGSDDEAASPSPTDTTTGTPTPPSPTDTTTGTPTPKERPDRVGPARITGEFFRLEDRDGDGTNDFYIGCELQNDTSSILKVLLAYEVFFPDGSTVGDEGSVTVRDFGATFDLAYRIGSPGYASEKQIEYIQDGDYEGDWWVRGIEG